MKESNAESLGRIVDRVANLIVATTLPLPATLHLSALREALPDIAVALRAIVVDETGDDPWQDHPEGWPNG